jgi:hypothetical protein
MKHIYVLISLLFGLAAFQLIGIIKLRNEIKETNHKLETSQAIAEAALVASHQARSVAFEAKKIATDNKVPEVTVSPNHSSCDPESGQCHYPRIRCTPYQQFMGGCK